jgi:molybdopterin molybdotransferase
VAALAHLGIQARFETCKDDLQALTDLVGLASQKADLLILTGGVSVGDFDFSRAALEANQFQVGFHQVAQKPGKPLLFSHRAAQFAFGLPGNPRAVLICFYLYVLPFVQALQGQGNLGLRQLPLPLAQDFKRKLDGKTHFLTGKLIDGQIHLMGGQQSHMLQSLAEADAIVKIPAEMNAASAGELLTCYLLP